MNSWKSARFFFNRQTLIRKLMRARKEGKAHRRGDDKHQTPRLDRKQFDSTRFYSANAIACVTAVILSTRVYAKSVSFCLLFLWFWLFARSKVDSSFNIKINKPYNNLATRLIYFRVLAVRWLRIFFFFYWWGWHSWFVCQCTVELRAHTRLLFYPDKRQTADSVWRTLALNIFTSIDL